MLTASILVAASLPSVAAAQVAISDYRITIANSDVLTMGHAKPLWARGTGLNNPGNRIVIFGDTVLLNDDCRANLTRGLTLSIFDTFGHLSNTNYDTWGSTNEADDLADALAALGTDQVGLLTSCDAFEANITAGLRQQASRLGLVRLASQPASIEPDTWRHPYVAMFRGAGPSGANHEVVEIVQPNTPGSPHAFFATWLIPSFAARSGYIAFVGPAPPERRPDPPCFNTTERFVNCGNGTVTDTVTGLIYLEDADCFGFQDWPTASESAARLSSGECGLSDGSRDGDWRLQTIEEWEVIEQRDCTFRYIVGNGADSTTSCYYDDPWASNLTGSTYWSSTTGPNTTTVWTFTVPEVRDGWRFKVETKGASNKVWPVRGGGGRPRSW